MLSDFFGTPGQIGPLGDTEDASLCLEYQGPLLKYDLNLLLADEVALVMANNIRHLGECLYEVNVPCSEITAVEGGLKFHYGPAADSSSLQMIIMKRADGELKVWPVGHYPPGHAHWRKPDSA